jgi:Tfp pilus assembly protein PilZ
MGHKHLRTYPRVQGDFPVEYTVGEQTFKARATILGGGGLFLRTDHDLRPGETLNVCFRPGKKVSKIEARAIVRSRSEPDGVGIKFTAMRPDHHQAILRFIHEKMEEKRKDMRAPFVAQVHYQGGTFLGLSKNISAGGIFVETKESLPVGAKLELRFHLDDGDPVIVAMGEVIYQVSKLGLAVRFVDVRPEDGERIEDYVAKGIAAVAPAAG